MKDGERIVKVQGFSVNSVVLVYLELTLTSDPRSVLCPQGVLPRGLEPGLHLPHLHPPHRLRQLQVSVGRGSARNRERRFCVLLLPHWSQLSVELHTGSLSPSGSDPGTGTRKVCGSSPGVATIRSVQLLGP